MQVIEDTCLSHVFTLLQYWPNVAFCVALKPYFVFSSVFLLPGAYNAAYIIA